MPSAKEKRRRKELQKQMRQQVRARLDASLPLTRKQLTGLFDRLDKALADGCEHDLRFTRAYLQAQGLPEEGIVPWLGELGGYCDCEVLANVEEHFPS